MRSRHPPAIAALRSLGKRQAFAFRTESVPEFGPIAKGVCRLLHDGDFEDSGLAVRVH